MVKNDNTLIIDDKPLIHRTATMQRLGLIRSLPWQERFFRSMNEGSMRRLILMWIGMCMGTANLTLPYFFSTLGLIPALSLLFFSCFLNFKMCTFINEMVMHTHSTNFYTLVERTVPRPFFVIFKYTLFVDILTTMMSISVVVWNMFEYILYSLGIAKSHWKEWVKDFDTFEVDESNPTIILIRGVFYLVLYVFMVRLFFKKSMGPLGIFLQLSVYATIVLVVFTLIDVPFFIKGYENEDIGFHLFKTPGFNYINGFYGFCFCYYVQPYMLSLRSELALPTRRRVQKTIKIGFISQAVLYSLLGTSAYISLGDKYTPNVIITRKAYNTRNPMWESTYRFVTIIYFISNAFCLCSYSPTLKICMRAFLKIKNKNRRRFVLSTVPFTVCCILSFVFPNILGIINLCGSTLYNYNGYIIPTLMKIKLMKEYGEGGYKLVLLYILLGGFIFSMGYGIVSPIIGLA